MLWLLPKVESFPRAYKFSVGDRLVDAGLDLLTLLVDAAYTSEKLPVLRQANRRVNSLRYLLRLSKDLRLIKLQAYEFASTGLEEIGRMAGGWVKASGARA
ncbi:MAG: diversity-generating retroelement protein Avd [Bryobacterales bacterium]|nr:diversity-generating retroelement protein Avd [Bryobacterales bacterium]